MSPKRRYQFTSENTSTWRSHEASRLLHCAVLQAVRARADLHWHHHRPSTTRGAMVTKAPCH